MAGVVIGIDPHKGSHTAVALDVHEKQLGRLRVRASSRQVDGLLEWASGWPRRRWAIEGARGLGQLLAQQLIASGERVLDVPPKLAARVRLLDSGQINKNDPNDARSVAVAALRAHELPELAAEDDAMVMRVWARRYHDLARLRTQVVCRLHAVVCELVPGGVRKYLRASQATDVLDRIVADSPVAQAKLELARELVADLERIDAQRREAKGRTARAVAATRTSINDVYGSGRSWPAPCSATSATSAASRPGTGSPPITAPHRSRSRPATGRSTGSPAAATDNSTTPSTWLRSARSATTTAEAAPTTRRRSPKG